MAEAKWAQDERRLQSAYDDISSGKIKSAQSAVDRHLKKHPKSQPGLVLRMVIDERNHQDTDAVLRAFDAVKETGELTGRSAWWLDLTLRNIQRLDLSLDLYRSLWDKQPNDPQIGEQVFLHAVAAWNPDVMKSSSRKMFNSLKSPVWARVAAWSEWITNAPQPTPDTLFAVPAPQNSLRIATTLLSTTGAANPTAEILWLKLQILLSAGDLQGALKIAQGVTGGGSLARSWYRMESVPVILERFKGERQEEWRVEWEWVKGVLQNDKDSQRNYAFYRYLLLTVSHLRDTSALEETQVLLNDLAKTIGDKERSPRLALLEHDTKVPTESRLSVQDWTKAVEAYWIQWGSKGSVVSELEGIPGDSTEKKECLAGIMKEKSETSHGDLQAYKELINATLLSLRLKPSEWIPTEEDVQRLWKLYREGLAYGRNLPSTDVQPADDIGLAAVHLLLIRWNKNKPVEAPLLRAMVCLRYILENSPSSAQAKFLLVRVARLSGVSSSVPSSLLSSSGPAEAQLDTLQHTLIERGSSEILIKGLPTEWLSMLTRAEKMYRRAAVDMPEYVKQALQHESYSRIPGIRNLTHTLSHSIPNAIVRIERARLRLSSNQSSSAEELQALESMVSFARNGELVDSRDWDLMPSIGGILPDLRSQTTMGEQIDAQWVQTWGEVLVGLNKFFDGEDVGGLGPIPDHGLLHAERAFLAVVAIILTRAKPSGEVVDGDQKVLMPEFKSALDELVRLASEDDQHSRFSSLYPLTLLVELAKILDQTSKRLEEMSRPQGKGKNFKKPEALIVELGTEIKNLKEEFKKTIKGVTPTLERLDKRDQDINWEGVNDGWFEDNDQEFFDQIKNEITKTRGESIRNLTKLLQGKKL